MADLAVSLLGHFRVVYKGELVTGLDSARLQSLFAYLLLHRNSPISRQYLALLFWPDAANESQAFTNLRNLLHKLRRALPAADDLLIADALAIWLPPSAPIDLDVTRFEAAAHSKSDQGRLEYAAQLYVGDLMPACYDDWIRPFRLALHEQACSVLTHLVDLLEQKREYARAISYATQLLHLNPVQETVYRTLMRLHALRGDRAAALSIYYLCVNTLEQEIGEQPDEETRAQYQRLLSGGHSFASLVEGHTVGRLPLIGRSSAWSTLLDRWRSAIQGAPQCIAVLGEAGIGKSRLVEELVTWASHQGYATAVGRCYGAGMTAAYAAVADWLRSSALQVRLRETAPIWLSEIGRLLPQVFHEFPGLPLPAPLTAEWQRRHLFDALVGIFARSSQPTLLVLEDAHWCDAATLDWLHYLLRSQEGAALLVVVTVRSEELDDASELQMFLNSLRRDNLLCEVHLDRLNDEDAAQLAQAAVSSPLQAPKLAQVIREAEGNPLFVVEIARLVQSGAHTVNHDDRQPLTLLSAEMLSPRIYSVLQSRFAQLPESAHSLLGLAATIGRQFTFAVLRAAWERDDEELVRNLDLLWRRKIVRELGTDQYDFSHGKLREAAYGTLSMARRRLLHRRVAHALHATSSADVELVAWQLAEHYELAGEFFHAAAWHRVAAAKAARVFANEDAVRLYQRAISLLSVNQASDDTLMPTLQEELGNVLHLLTQYGDARAAYQAALARLDGADFLTQTRLLRMIGNTWREQYQYEAAISSYEAALSVLEGCAERKETIGSQVSSMPDASVADEETHTWWQAWIQVHLELGSIQYWTNQVDAFGKVGDQLELAIERFGTTSQQALYWRRRSELSFRENQSVPTQETIDWMQRSVDALMRAGDTMALPDAYFGLGFLMLWSGELENAVASLQKSLDNVRLTGNKNLRARVLTYLAIAHRMQGAAEEVRQCTEECLAIATAARMPEYVGAAHANLAWLAWREGDFITMDAQAHLAVAAWALLPQGHASLRFQWTCFFPLIDASLQRNLLEEAVGFARRLLGPGQQRLPDDLATALARGAASWGDGARDQTRQHLDLALQIAKSRRYL